MDRYIRKTANYFLWTSLISILLIAPVRAASVTFFMDQSNKLPDGSPYLSVMLTENATGGVDFLVQTLDGLNDIAGSRFGIQKFGFSFADGVSGAVSGLPDYWRVQQNRRMDGFGKFDVRLQGPGKARTDSLSFTVSGTDIGDFESLFSAHVAGFRWCEIDERRLCGARNCITSAFFAGEMDAPTPEPVPVPGAAWLFVSGLLGLIGFGKHRRSARV